MAKKKINIDKYASGLFLRTEEYADKVRQHYAAAVEELLKLSAKRHISPGETFSFADNKKLSESANIVLRGLYSAVYNEIKSGVAAEWQYANLSCDALIESIFGKGIMSDNHFAHWFSRNQDAMDAFFARKSAYGGMNLSQKVWKYTGELKTEMELALTLSMGEGEGASVISRKVRQYLQEPERLFRRIKTGTDANGEPLYKLSKAAKAYHPGRGVYRSSYKNAMRLTRTETNMAYRTADYTRWQQLPFVVGVRVKLSKNHNCIGVPKGQFYDICDELAGDYPKSFKLVGWHPQCRCFTEPILAEEDEFVAIQKRVLAGEDVQSYNSVNEVKAMPKQMVKWMEKNKERMDAASTLPYWLQDNKSLVDDYGSINPNATNNNINKNQAKKLGLPFSQNLTQQERIAIENNCNDIETQFNIKRTNPMTYDQANNGRENPNYSQKGGYLENCQTCTVSHLLRRRGFDVSSHPNIVLHKKHIGTAYEKLNKVNVKWTERFLNIDGSPIDYDMTYMWMRKKGYKKMTSLKLREYINEKMTDDGLYEIYCQWKKKGAHVFCAEVKKGQIRFFDPQSGEHDVIRYFKNMRETRVGIIRIDNKIINPKIKELFVF